jgi:hypothetical protein
VRPRPRHHRLSPARAAGEGCEAPFVGEAEELNPT